MKLHLSILEKLIELPTKDPLELRHIFDDLGLEVKDIENQGGKVVYNIETLANRGDHLYALGVAREISARYLTSLKYPPVAAEFGQHKTSIPVKSIVPQCYRYALLEMTLPANMRLRPDIAAIMSGGEGEEEHPAIVDLLNYVQLELGQPMHAFDRDKIDGEISVDLTKQNETIEALDGKSYTLPLNSIVIRDRSKIVAVGGVIGCANSMISWETTRVLIESACFDPVSVRKTARGMNLSTDASYAFERGADREGAVMALRRLVYLAEGSGGVVKQADSAHALGFSYVEGAPVEKRKVVLNVANVRRQISAPRLGDVEVTSRLKNLGYTVEPQGETGQYHVWVPSWRLWDVRNEEDLIEDFVRSHGLSHIKMELPPLDYETPLPGPVEALYAKIEKPLVGHGFYEVITRSFYSGDAAELLAKLAPELTKRHVMIKNAVERGYSHLKVTNVISLCQLALQNLKKGVLSVKVYELGRLFSRAYKGQESPEPGYDYERDVVTMAAAGRWHAGEWKKPEDLEEKVYLFKGALEAVFAALGREVMVTESQEKLLHPGYQGGLKVGRINCGFFGVVHPLIRDNLGLKEDVLYAELDVSQMLRLGEVQSTALPSEFPAVRRDLTLKIPERELAGRVIRFIEEVNTPNLQEIGLVNDFRKAEESFRRLSLRLTFQSSERTLEHAEIDQSVGAILSHLRDKHQIELAN